MWNIWIRSLAPKSRRRQHRVHLIRASSFKLQMYFFKNGTGWCVRHDSRTKPQAASSKPHAPVFRKLQATSGKTTLSKLVKKVNKENAPPGGW